MSEPDRRHQMHRRALASLTAPSRPPASSWWVCAPEAWEDRFTEAVQRMRHSREELDARTYPTDP